MPEKSTDVIGEDGSEICGDIEKVAIKKDFKLNVSVDSYNSVTYPSNLLAPNSRDSLDKNEIARKRKLSFEIADSNTDLTVGTTNLKHI